ncbi:MAG: GGDEF domain-containing protein [Streptosporangiaceae bacterium]|nr:GGDEF domain-containing protein [Streptosporangiaceae bacterium]
MTVSSLTRRVLARTDVRKWTWWQLPRLPRWYIGAVPVVALGMVAFAASQTVWRSSDLSKFGLLLGCGMISVAATPRIAYGQGQMVRDFLTVWVLPVAILLPPVYAMLTPAPLLVLTQWRIHRGVVYRRVFTAGAISMAYGVASLTFHAIPPSFAGPSIGAGTHALTWTLAVAACEIVGWLGHHIFLVSAIKLCDPTARLTVMELNGEALHADFAQIDLGLVTTVVIGVNPVLAIFAVPTVLLARRFMMHAQLLAKSRLDNKTGLLNASTWESEAEAEIARAIRTGSPVSVALVDIDHFKVVNDTYGHLAGDLALRAVSDAIREHLRSYDVAGRFGGEEFVLLLPQADEADALSIAERLRTHIASMPIPIDAPTGGRSTPAGTCVRLTVSVGIAALDGTARELTDLLAAADSALYYAKENGRNKTHAVAAVGLR